MTSDASAATTISRYRFSHLWVSQSATIESHRLCTYGPSTVVTVPFNTCCATELALTTRKRFLLHMWLTHARHHHRAFLVRLARQSRCGHLSTHPSSIQPLQNRGTTAAPLCCALWKKRTSFASFDGRTGKDGSYSAVTGALRHTAGHALILFHQVALRGQRAPQGHVRHLEAAAALRFHIHSALIQQLSLEMQFISVAMYSFRCAVTSTRRTADPPLRS